MNKNMKAVYSSKTSVTTYQTTRCYNIEHTELACFLNMILNIAIFWVSSNPINIFSPLITVLRALSNAGLFHN
jgi:hypothetical protein